MDEDEYPVWAGPGWSWGVYITNENDSWNHYNQHYGNRRGNDRGGEPALHVAGASAIDPAVLHQAGKGIDGPAVARLDHVDMRVEMHAGAGRAAVEARDHVDSRIAVAVAWRALGTDEFGFEAEFLQTRAKELGAWPIGLAWRIDRREADQIRGQRNEFVCPVLDRPEKSLIHAKSFIHPAD